MSESNGYEFELGEDVRDENRLRQDEEWANAVADGRGHVSHRELTMLNAPQFCMAIEDYRIIEQLVESLYGKKSIFRKLTPELLQIIVEFGMPGHGPIVNTCIIKRNITPLLFANKMENSCSIVDNSFPFRVCVRKRPMADYEKSFGSYDVCNTQTKNHITLHEGKLARNGRQLSMTHYEYVFDEVYGETATNLQVCQRSVEPLLSWAMKGNQSSLLCFGQTGTGKTYTLYGALQYISTRLINHTVRITFYEVHGKKCYDLLAKRKVIHLRSDANDIMHVRGAKTVTLSNVTDADEIIAVLSEALALRSSEMTERNPISSRSHAVCTIEIARQNKQINQSGHAMSLSAFLESKGYSNLTAINAVNELPTPLSPHLPEINTALLPSPPHAVSLSAVDIFESCGRITLVDLAGSERNYETTQMTSQQHKESADINFALMALKNCFRAYHQQLVLNNGNYAKPNAIGQGGYGGYGNNAPLTNDCNSSVSNGDGSAETSTIRIPYRSSLLTKVLKDCFTLDSVHRTTIIATVSPTPVDLQHTINTLSHVILMSPTLHKLTDRLTVEVPMTTGYALSTTPVSEWTAEQVNAWLGIAENGRFSHVVLPHKMDGQGLLRLTATNLAELFTTQENKSRKDLEGSAWVVSADETDKQYSIANMLWSAVRREQQSALVKIKMAKQKAASAGSDLGRFVL